MERDADGPALAFAAFALNHAACGEGLIEIRLGERCILEWCPSCAAMRVFVSPVARQSGVRVVRA